MKIPSTNKVAFEDLGELLTNNSKFLKSDSSIDSSIRLGRVQIFKLTAGLQVKFWDFKFNEGLELHNGEISQEETYFTLTYFKNIEGFKIGNRDTHLKQSIIWDTILFCSKANCRMYFTPNIRYQCISISFSKNWLKENVFTSSDQFKTLEDKMCIPEGFSILEFMNRSEKKLIEELLHICWKNLMGTFYIKSGVLKLIYDFFRKISDKEIAYIKSGVDETAMNKVEKILIENLSGKLPNLREVASQFGITQLTLTKSFKKKYGINISTYYLRRKIEYAKQLLQDNNAKITEVALFLGYKNVKYFEQRFKKECMNDN